AAGLLQDLGYAETAADLDQLAARDDRSGSFAESCQREQRGAGAIVHHVRRFGAEQLAEKRLDGGAAVASAARVEIQLQIRIPGGDLRDARDGLRVKRRASQIRMQHDAGCVDDAPQTRLRL